MRLILLAVWGEQVIISTRRSKHKNAVLSLPNLTASHKRRKLHPHKRKNSISSSQQIPYLKQNYPSKSPPPFPPQPLNFRREILPNPQLLKPLRILNRQPLLVRQMQKTYKAKARRDIRHGLFRVRLLQAVDNLREAQRLRAFGWWHIRLWIFRRWSSEVICGLLGGLRGDVSVKEV